MSFTYTQAVFKANLPGMEKLILWVLAERANDEGRCFPGQAKIAKDAGISYSTAQRNLDKLIKRGLVTVVGQARYKNTFALSTKDYQLDLAAINNLAAQSLQGYRRRATSGIGAEPTRVGGELPPGSGERTGVVAESLLKQSVKNQSAEESENQSDETATEAAADAASAALCEIETEFLTAWYEKRVIGGIGSVPPAKLAEDLVTVKQILAAAEAPRHAVRLLRYALADSGDEKWAGWDKKTPHLKSFLKHIKGGNLAAQHEQDAIAAAAPKGKQWFKGKNTLGPGHQIHEGSPNFLEEAIKRQQQESSAAPEEEMITISTLGINWDEELA
jgi:hypothetical protein